MVTVKVKVTVTVKIKVTVKVKVKVKVSSLFHYASIPHRRRNNFRGKLFCLGFGGVWVF